MARPTTKQDLILASNEKYSKLWDLINSLSDKEKNQEFKFDENSLGKEAHWKRDKNIRDVLIHLYEWHQLLIKWVNANQSGEETKFLPEPYNWKTYGEMNIEFWRVHQNTSYISAKDMLEKSHKQVMELIETFKSEELFSKGTYSWTGGSTLGSYCVSATASHYEWAMKKLKKYKKSLLI